MPPRLHILATDTDTDPGIRDVLAVILEEEGYRVTFATDQTIAAVAADPPALILLDGRGLADESGWAFLERLKADPATAAIPVLMLTGESRGMEEHAARLADLDTVLVRKPFDLDDLVARVGRRLAGESA